MAEKTLKEKIEALNQVLEETDAFEVADPEKPFTSALNKVGKFAVNTVKNYLSDTPLQQGPITEGQVFGEELNKVAVKEVLKERLADFEQCFLLTNEEEISKSTSRDQADYRFMLLDANENEQSTLLESLFIPNDLQKAFEFTQEKLAYLIPKLKIFVRKYKDHDRTSYVKQPLIFDDHLNSTNINTITERGAGRASGVGIKSFNWNWRTFSGHERDNDIQGKLKLVFQSMEDFIEDSFITKRKFEELDKVGTNSNLGFNIFQNRIKLEKQHLVEESLQRKKARFIDLVPGYGIPGVESEIEIAVGWNIVEENASLFSESERQVIRKMGLTLSFTLTGYNINVLQNGTIEFEIRMQGKVESLLSSPYLDLFLLANRLTNTKEILQEIAAKIGFSKFNIASVEEIQNVLFSNERRIEEYERKRNEAVARDEYDEESNKDDNFVKWSQLLEETQELSERLDSIKTQARYSALPVLLFENAKLYVVESETVIPDPEKETFGSNLQATENIRVLRYNNEGIQAINPFISGGEGELSIDEEGRLTEESVEEFLADDMTVFRRDNGTLAIKNKVNFFYLGDMLNELVALMYDSNNMENMRVLVGPMTIQGKSINMADIPISYKQFMVWYWKKITSIHEDFYPLRDFLKDFVNEYLLSMYRNCLELVDKQVDFDIINFSLTSNDYKDPITRTPPIGNFFLSNLGIPRENVSNINLKDSQNTDGKYTHEYMILHAIQHIDYLGEPNVIRDNRRGVIHLRIGDERGLLKRVVFERDDSPEADAHRTKAGEVLGYLWKAKVYLYGSPKFYPSQTIYIDPTLMGAGEPIAAREYSSYLGIGGYYTINSVSSVLGFDGKYETVLDTYPIFNHNRTIGRISGLKGKKEIERYAEFQNRFDNEKIPEGSGTANAKGNNAKEGNEALTAIAETARPLQTTTATGFLGLP